MRPGEVIALCLTICIGWGVLAHSAGLPMWVAGLGGAAIALLWLPPVFLAISKKNRGGFDDPR